MDTRTLCFLRQAHQKDPLYSVCLSPPQVLALRELELIENT